MGISYFLAGFVVMIVGWGLTLVRIEQLRRLDFASVFLFTLGVFHGVLLIFVYWLATVGQLEAQSFVELASYPDSYVWVYTGLVVVFATGTFLGASVGWGGRATTRKAAWFSTPTQEADRRLIFAGWVLLLISIVSYWLYARAYGGFVDFVINSRAIKSGQFSDFAITNRWSFMGRFGGLAFVASFLFWGRFIAAPRKGSISLWAKTGLVASFIVSFYVLLTWWSRGYFIFYIIAFPVSALVRKYRLKFGARMISTLGVVLLVLAGLLGAANYTLKGVQSPERMIARAGADVSIRILPTFVLVEEPEYRWFRDIAQSPAYTLPKRIWEDNIVDHTASDVMTIKMRGAEKGESGVTGAVVIGAVPFALMQGGVVGLAVLSVFWGMLLAFLDRWLLVRLPPGFSETIYAYIVFRFVVSSIWGADPAVVIYNHIPIIAGLVLLLIIVGLTRVRWI